MMTAFGVLALLVPAFYLNAALLDMRDELRKIVKELAEANRLRRDGR